MSADMQASLEAAEKLFTAVERGKLDDIRGIFAPNARIWHNDDGSEIDVEKSISGIRAIQSNCDDFRYTQIKRLPTPEGFVQQHVLIIRLKNGPVIEDRACCVCRVVDGRITRMDAYHDSAVFKVPGFAARN